MSVSAPHFLLYSEAAQAAEPAATASGRWRFVLQSPRGETALEAADDETASSGERLELLAIVRGLEALDQPSKVTLMTGSRDIQRGMQFGLAQWREHDWHWERYGQMTPVKNGDLWRRIDRLLEIHEVACRPRRLDKADDLASPQPATARRAANGRSLRIDPPAAKSAACGAQQETNSKTKYRQSGSRSRFGHWNCLAAGLFRISNLVLRAFAARG